MVGGFPIGEAARRSGCSAATIRFYESMGLIPEAARTARGRRLFTRADIERLRFVRRLRAMEFGIDSIKALLAAMRGAGSCLDVRDIAQEQLQVVRARLAEMDALEQTLAALTGRCNEACAEGVSRDCTIMDDLARGA